MAGPYENFSTSNNNEGYEANREGGYRPGDWGGLPGSGEIWSNFANPGLVYPDYPGREEVRAAEAGRHHSKTSSAPGRMVNTQTAGRAGNK